MSLRASRPSEAFTAAGSIHWSVGQEEEDVDFHEDSMKGRLITLNTCSCQWSVAFAGLPCRHICLLHLHISLQSKENYMITVRGGILYQWRLAGEEDTNRGVAELRRASAAGDTSGI